MTKKKLNPIQRSIIQDAYIRKREWDSHYRYSTQRKIALKRMMVYFKFKNKPHDTDKK